MQFDVINDLSHLLIPVTQTVAIIVSNLVLFPSKLKYEGTIFAVFILINRSFMVMLLMSSFLLAYFCYYIVACYIRLLALDMKRPFRLTPVEKITGAKAKTIAWYLNKFKKKKNNF